MYARILVPLQGFQSGRVIVDMTSSSPALAQEIHTRSAALGVSALDAPVSGGGTLTTRCVCFYCYKRVVCGCLPRHSR